MSWVIPRSTILLALVWFGACRAPSPALPPAPRADSPSRLSDEALPPQVEGFPDRPAPLLEWGDPFLATGPIGDGFRIPTGARWRPALQVFGTLRSALQTFDGGRTTNTEWANRLDLYGNLQFTGTERLLVGVRPFDDDGRYSGYVFEPDAIDGWEEEFNTRITTLFFEGEVGELFPTLDPSDSGTLDLGFSIGRQPIVFQDGLLIDDDFDAIGITRNTLLPGGSSNLRVTGLWAFNEIERDDNRPDESAQLFGLFSEADLPKSTVSLDAVWVDDRSERTDALYLGAGAVQRLGPWNTTVRAVGSLPSRDNTPEASEGWLLFTEVSRTLPRTDHIAYATAFLGINHYASAARGPERGGPLGRTGILFAAVGLGRYGAPLGNRADDSVGGAVGLQLFPDWTVASPEREQIVFELGGRDSTDGLDEGALAIGTRYSRAFGQRWVLRLDGFVAGREDESPTAGLRLEWSLRF